MVKEYIKSYRFLFEALLILIFVIGLILVLVAKITGPGTFVKIAKLSSYLLIAISMFGLIAGISYRYISKRSNEKEKLRLEHKYQQFKIKAFKEFKYQGGEKEFIDLFRKEFTHQEINKLIKWNMVKTSISGLH